MLYLRAFLRSLFMITSSQTPSVLQTLSALYLCMLIRNKQNFCSGPRAL